ncbi:Crp/Fnr family transcriptional regulator [Nocardiopsis chromatogenes]|uniref:Crp/Fnr family transcriptional regulator n=1 Tax=Nocardiopsis chromatogenes TaxID=280239 RepID=UPI000347A515|nr:Crp/Fnr family transcriptional regulator [Nocardiopsis chromatogenes]
MSTSMRPPAPVTGCLTEAEVLRDLAIWEKEEIGRQAPSVRVPAGGIVRAPGDPEEALFIVKQGRVRLFRVSEEGRTATVGTAGPGTVFGAMRAAGLRMDGTWAEAVDEAELCRMGEAEVRRLLLSDARVSARIIALLGDRLAECEQRLAGASFASAAQRVAATLLGLTGGGPSPERIRLTHEQLARLTGITREHTTRALGELADLGLVRLGRGRIAVLDPEGLRRLRSGEEDCQRPDRRGGRRRAPVLR